MNAILIYGYTNEFSPSRLNGPDVSLYSRRDKFAKIRIRQTAEYEGP